MEPDFYLLKGEVEKAAKSLDFGGLRRNPEIVRLHLISAEINRIKGDLLGAQAEIDNAMPWILRSASVEHLCFSHLIRARIMIDQEQFDYADAELKEGLHLARRCKFGLYHIDFLNEQGKFFLELAKDAKSKGLWSRHEDLLNKAEKAAQSALYGILKDSEEPANNPDSTLSNLTIMGAQHPECQYAWGEADALGLLGKIMLEKNDRKRAEGFLTHAIYLQNKLGHPSRRETEELLNHSSFNRPFWRLT